MNKLVTFIVALMLMLTQTIAQADNNMIASKINEASNYVKTFVVNEKDKTISYQKKSWEEVRLQLVGLLQSLSNAKNKILK